MRQSVVSNYVEDIMRNYGDGGQRINLPERANATFQEGLQFRQREKAYYGGLEDQVRSARHEAAHYKQVAEKHRATATHFAKFIKDLESYFPEEGQSDAAATNRDGLGNDGRDSGGDVLPIAGHSDETDTEAREVEATISSTSVTDEPPSTSRRRPRGNNARTKQEEVPKTGGQDSAPGTDAGRALPDAPDEPEPDVGGSAAEHDAAE